MSRENYLEMIWFWLTQQVRHNIVLCQVTFLSNDFYLGPYNLNPLFADLYNYQTDYTFILYNYPYTPQENPSYTLSE